MMSCAPCEARSERQPWTRTIWQGTKPPTQTSAQGTSEVKVNHVYGLPFDEIWLIDFEFVAKPGERPDVLCMVARELGSGHLIRLWKDELPTTPPFRTDGGALFVAYFSSAEWGCFLQLGWDVPQRVLDLYAEFRTETNGLPLPTGRGLLGAMSYHGLTGITKDEKADMRSRITEGGPFNLAERQAILDYCQSDVDALSPLLERMLPGIRSSPVGLGRALLRGRYMCAVSRMEHTGVPIDVPTLRNLRNRWEAIKGDLIAAVDADFGVYEQGSFRSSRFGAWLDQQGIVWPRLPSGGLALDGDTFRDMAKTHPQVAPLKDLRGSLGELRLMDLSVGSDGRNRALLSPFASRTGRNQPSNTRFVFGPSVWIRNLITPPEGRALAYLDWKSQEVAIAAALSGDAALQQAVETGDPYLSFARMAGLVPADATKATHPREREMCKVALLGTNYGMGVQLLARQAAISTVAAAELLRRLRATFPTYFRWAEENVNRALLEGSIETTLGWRLHVRADSRPNSLLNFPMQANGAEMLRLAACLVTEAGVDVCAPVHDALLIEADSESIEVAVSTTAHLMKRASADLLDGWEIGTDVVVVGPGERYSDPRGTDMWTQVMGLIDVRRLAPQDFGE